MGKVSEEKRKLIFVGNVVFSFGSPKKLPEKSGKNERGQIIGYYLYKYVSLNFFAFWLRADRGIWRGRGDLGTICGEEVSRAFKPNLYLA